MPSAYAVGLASFPMHTFVLAACGSSSEVLFFISLIPGGSKQAATEWEWTVAANKKRSDVKAKTMMVQGV